MYPIGSRELQGFYILNEVLIGRKFIMFFTKDNQELDNVSSYTSPVTNFDENTMTLTTENSKYKIHIK